MTPPSFPEETIIADMACMQSQACVYIRTYTDGTPFGHKSQDKVWLFAMTERLFMCCKNGGLQSF